MFLFCKYPSLLLIIISIINQTYIKMKPIVSQAEKAVVNLSSYIVIGCWFQTNIFLLIYGWMKHKTIKVMQLYIVIP